MMFRGVLITEARGTLEKFFCELTLYPLHVFCNNPAMLFNFPAGLPSTMARPAAVGLWAPLSAGLALALALLVLSAQAAGANPAGEDANAKGTRNGKYRRGYSQISFLKMELILSFYPFSVGVPNRHVSKFSRSIRFMFMFFKTICVQLQFTFLHPSVSRTTPAPGATRTVPATRRRSAPTGGAPTPGRARTGSEYAAQVRGELI